MNQENLDISKMLKEVGSTAEIVGVAKLTEFLKDIRKTHKEITQEEYDKAKQLISIVCDEYQMTTDEFYCTLRKNNRRYALAFVFFILYKKYYFDYNKIHYVTKKSFTVISTLIKEVEEMSRTHPFEKKMLSKLDNILLKIENN
jgi:hypothetical protein